MSVNSHRAWSMGWDRPSYQTAQIPKCEIRSTKHETNSNVQNHKYKTERKRNLDFGELATRRIKGIEIGGNNVLVI